LIADFFSNISAKHYEHLTMLLRVTAKNIGDFFIDTLETFEELSTVEPLIQR